MQSSYTHQTKVNPTDGSANPQYVDILSEDPPMKDQAYFCMSFIAPQDILKRKEVFFFEEFTKQWALNQQIQVLRHFVEFAAFKYNLDRDAFRTDFEEFVKTEQDTLRENASTVIEEDYKTFLEQRGEDLQKRFDRENNFQTNVMGIKFRGAFPTMEDARAHAKLLREMDKNNNTYHPDTFVGMTGYWAPYNPDSYRVGDVDYMEEELNTLMHKKKENEEVAKRNFEKRVLETKRKCMEENREKAEKYGNRLTQTMDEHGNLVSIQQAGLTEDPDASPSIVSGEELFRELFEGEDIVMKPGDHGQSQLLSGPFANRREKNDDDA